MAVTLFRLRPAIVSFFTLVSAILGCALPVMQESEVALVWSIYLLKSTFTSGSSSISIAVGDYACTELKSIFSAAAAFGILGCIGIGFATIFASVAPFMPQIPDAAKYVVVFLQLGAAGACLIAWALVLHVYMAPLCGAGVSYGDAGVELYTGFFFLIAASVKAVFAAVITAWRGFGGRRQGPDDPLYRSVQ